MNFLADIQKQAWKKRSGSPSLIIVHHCDLAKADPAVPSAVATYLDFISAFTNRTPPQPGSYTGGKFPYTFVVEQSGRVVQVAPISAATPHGRKWNDKGLGIMFVGDFNRTYPSAEQWLGGAQLISELSAAGFALNGVKGHTSLPGASADATKVCPGKHFNLQALALDAKGLVPQGLTFK